jgi:tRNA dimethylallyltransferase
MVDPRAFARIHRRDRYRSQRALEIHRIAGRPMSDLQDEQRPAPSLGLTFPTVVLERPVDQLDARIAERTEQMLRAGWIAETEDALARHPGDCPGLQSIGYREIVRFLVGEMDRERLAADIVLVTRQYAKRQRTWFRRTPRIAAGPPDAPEIRAALAEHLRG